MRQSTLLIAPDDWQDRIDYLHDTHGLSGTDANILLQVEVAFVLMEKLNLSDEPITAAWVLLSKAPIADIRLRKLSATQKKAWANGRQLIPYPEKFNWLNAVRDYQRLPLHLRMYIITETDFDTQYIDAAKRPPHEREQQHEHLYDKWLSQQLPFRQRNTHPYTTQAGSYKGSGQVQINIGNTQLQTEERDVLFNLSPGSISSQTKPTWLSPPAVRAPFQVDMAAFTALAQHLDECETTLARRLPITPRNWQKRLSELRCHIIDSAGKLPPDPTSTFTIRGFMHLAGMVSSGKSTLASLLAAHIVKDHPEKRITLLVSDVQTAIQLANQINEWFCDDPDTDAPVAVPIFGRSSLHTHMRGFYASTTYLAYAQCGAFHWGERWLNSLCPLQYHISDSDRVNVMQSKSFIPGTEPCQIIQLVDETKKAEKKKPDKSKKTKKLKCACPYLPVCPQYQLYRDLPTARVWITTPGGMSSGTLPRQLDSRPIRVGELVYEQSDVVVFDEVDTLINWFDNQFATLVTLTNGNDGILDKITVNAEEYAVQNRGNMPSGTLRWIGAERNAQHIVSSVLTLLHRANGQSVIQQWVSRHYFTPMTLFYKLSRRLAGFAEFDDRTLSLAERRRQDTETQTIFDVFASFLNEPDPLRPDRLNEADAAFELCTILNQINSTGDNATDNVILLRCQSWIRRTFPKTEQRLQKLKEQITTFQQDTSRPKYQREYEVDTLSTLATRLQFALTVTLLDRHTRIVFFDWTNRPATIQQKSPSYRNQTTMRSILPLPLTGRQFGTYYASGTVRSDRQPSKQTNTLNLFAYTNIGRDYVLNLHQLLTDYTGQPGPAVLAMSGTSYLPDSTTFHVGKPDGVLLPDQKAVRLIGRESQFVFMPQQGEDNKPIRLSGAGPDRVRQSINQLCRALVGQRGKGQLHDILNELTQLAASDPEHWADRQRLLLFVNSYEQARWVATELRQHWTAKQDSIRYVVPDRNEAIAEPDEAGRHLTDAAIRRADIEQFSQTDGTILVAPLAAVGRGLNILNQHRKAAFGAVFFLTRPYPHPHDAQAIAREMNRRALDWEADETFGAWQTGVGLLGKAEAARKSAVHYWRSVENRAYYSTLHDDPELRARPRRDLAATTIGYIIQAVGRLIRGNVPFRAYFVDAAWAPELAANPEAKETPETSLLAAMIDLLAEYTDEDPICRALYQPLADALLDTTYNGNPINWKLR